MPTLSGVTTGTARSATQFSTADVEVAERPTTTIKIGSKTYTARAPKFIVYRETVRLLSAVDLVRDLADVADRTDDEQAQLEALSGELADQDKLEEAIIYGQPVIENGQQVGLRGGWLRRSLTSDDWAAILAELHDDDSDLDIEHLYTAARHLQEAFGPWFENREAAIGLPSTKAAPPARSSAKPRARGQRDAKPKAK